jgi:thiol-disulfide isomerase/thioredoxin
MKINNKNFHILNETSPVYIIPVFLLIFLLSLNEVLLAKDPSQLPSFRIRNLSGEKFDSRKHQGKTLVLSFFFTRCPPCRKEMPALYNFMSQEGLLEQLLFVDPFVEALKIRAEPDTERGIRDFINSINIPPERVFFDEIGTLLKKMSHNGAFPKASQLGTLVVYPTIIVIDGSGKLVLSLEGTGPNFLEKIRQKL